MNSMLRLSRYGAYSLLSLSCLERSLLSSQLFHLKMAIIIVPFLVLPCSTIITTYLHGETKRYQKIQISFLQWSIAFKAQRRMFTRMFTKLLFLIAKTVVATTRMNNLLVKMVFHLKLAYWRMHTAFPTSNFIIFIYFCYNSLIH